MRVVAFGVAVAVVVLIFSVLVAVLLACRQTQSSDGSKRERERKREHENDDCLACCGSSSSLLEVKPQTRSNLSSKQWAAIHARVHPYAIYFPQFHATAENDTLFYRGMTDMTNLTGLLAATPDSGLDTPDLRELQLSTLTAYDCSNPALVARQAVLATEWGFQGFCIYFYWFAVNTITRRHQIMEACINTFFNDATCLPAGFKVFFDWANEDWTKNAAFGAARDDGTAILNVYTREAFQDFTALLLTYFRHDRYLKVDGKPVLFLHHPWFLTAQEMELLRATLQLGCLAHGFSGVHLCVNRVAEGDADEDKDEDKDKDLQEHKDTTTSFKFRPDYKSGRFPDYEAVIDDAASNPDFLNINTMFFGFNNAARMFKPPKPHRVHAIASTHQQQQRLLRACIATYEHDARSELQKLFLVNSWNEWGEDMAVEPGKQNGTRFLQMLADTYAAMLLL